MVRNGIGAGAGFACVAVLALGVTIAAQGCGSDDDTGGGAPVVSQVDGGGTTTRETLECGVRTVCGKLCVDLQRDAFNCGACNKACAAGEVCSAGTCALGCGLGTMKCGTTCEDVKVDPNNCGACGRVCEAGEVCSDGQCAVGCNAGTTFCGGAGDAGGYCASTSTDANNCGTCGTVCAAGLVCANGGCCEAGTQKCGNACVDTSTSATNCGACGNNCAASQFCRAGKCEPIRASCKAIKTANPAAADGVYTIDPDAAGAKTPFQVYCDMTTDGGGWTLLLVATNADGNMSWRPSSPSWIDDIAFGDATRPLDNVDAKSRAFAELAVDEVMIKTPTLVEIETNTGCVNAAPFVTMFQRNGSVAADCAIACSTKLAAGAWTGQSQQDSSKLRFRCSDFSDVTGPGGFTMSSDDNSMITTMVQDQIVNFGIGSGWGARVADFDATTVDAPDPTDLVQRLVFAR